MATAKTRMSQLDKVVRHLKMFETLTPMEALKDYGIMPGYERCPIFQMIMAVKYGEEEGV